MTGVAFVLVLLAHSASGQALQKERTGVRQKLAAERAGLFVMEGQRADVTWAIARIEALARAAVQRATALGEEAKAVERRLAVAEAREGLAREALTAQLARLGPRLGALYRLTRRSRLDLLLSAPDLSQMFWRGWAVKQLLRSDLQLVEETQLVARYQDRARRRLEAMREGVVVQRQALGEIRERERESMLDFRDTLGLLQAQARVGREAVKDLERADHELGNLIRQLEQGPSTSGFGALRGRLPLPAAGLVEVGFGRVVNPRFNTVVEHKGLDIRAPQGTAVKAVAEGRVVWTGSLRGYGNLLILDHGAGYHTLMAHLSDFTHQVGDVVKPGEEVARVGDSGSLKGTYLYFEVRVRGLAVDPAPWLSSL